MKKYRSINIEVEILEECPVNCPNLYPEKETLFSNEKPYVNIWKCSYIEFCRSIFSEKGMK